MEDTLSNSTLSFKSLRKWFFFIIAVAILTYLIVNTTRGVYTLLTECWVCYVVENIYDAFSKVSNETFYLFQNDALLILSIALALWIVYETYQVFMKGISSNPDINITPDFFKNIYKKLFLAVFVIWVFLLNSPRNVFSNTYEIVLDFGSGIGRSILHKKINDLELNIPEECKNQPTELVYNKDMALSENTKNNMVCMIKEVNVLRQNYIQIGINLFEYGLPSMITAAVVNVSIRLAGFFGGRALQQYGSEKWLKKLKNKIGKNNKKSNRLKEALDNLINDIQSDGGDFVTDKRVLRLEKKIARNDKNSKKLANALDDAIDDIKNGGQNTKRVQNTGRVVSNNASKVADVSSIVAIITDNDIRMGLTGVALIIGFFLVNMLFAFIIVENMLFMGVSLLIFPFLAICYVFNETRSYATAGLKKLWSFAKGIIFVCIAIIICDEVNDWVLGGMFTAPNETNISSTKYALRLLEAGEIDKFNDLVKSPFYFFYAIFAVIINFLVIKESTTFAGWFTGSISQSGLGNSVWNFSKSIVSWSKSAGRELVGYKKHPDDITLNDKAKFIGGKIKNKFSKSKKQKTEDTQE